jgi:hypothetical protein
LQWRRISERGNCARYQQENRERDLQVSRRYTLQFLAQSGGAASAAHHTQTGEHHMTILSDIFDALAAAAIVAGVICLAIAMNP